MFARAALVLVALLALCCLPAARSFAPPLFPGQVAPLARPPLRPSAATARIRDRFGLGLRVLGEERDDERFVDFVDRLRTATPAPVLSDEEVDREALVTSGKVGMRLYADFTHHINQHYESQLRCMAMKLHDPDEEPWSGGELQLHQANILAMDSRGFDIQVTLCSGGTCWLSVVHARLPFRADTPSELFQAFDNVCESCMCSNSDDVSFFCRNEEEIMPEYFDQMTALLNRDFLSQVNKTVTDLSGLDAASGEYIATIKVCDVSGEGLRALVNFCNFEKCSSMEVEIAFPRTAADQQDFRDELMACLGDGSAGAHECVVKGVQVVDFDCSLLEP